MRKISIAALALAAISAPAAGQAWIGQIVGQMIANGQAAAAYHSCMMGTPMPQPEIAEARGPAIATMEGYFAAAQKGEPRSRYFKLDKKARWISGEGSFGSKELDAQSDPLAGPGRWLQLEEFVRSGQNAQALGQWRVRGADGALAGTYTGFFVREQGDWKLRTLEVIGPRSYAAPIEQFCDDPGDVFPYRQTYTENTRVQAEKSLGKAERKFAKYRDEADAAEAKAAKNPKSSLARTEAAKARDTADDWAGRVERAKVALEAARTAEAEVIAEAKAREERKAASLAQLQGA